MTKIVRSKYKASRRLGVSLWGDGKDAFNTRNYRPGQHGRNTMVKTSDYGLHLKAKQRIKCHYGRITEKQFRNIFGFAQKMKGNTGENFIGLLESRLDSIVYRMNIVPTIFSSRQLISHGHIKVNGKKADIASMRLKEGDVIEIKEASRQMGIIQESVSKQGQTTPDYVSFDVDSLSGKYLRVPTISDVRYPFTPEVHLVVELYSR